jgi:hypothetical protein
LSAEKEREGAGRRRREERERKRSRAKKGKGRKKKRQIEKNTSLLLFYLKALLFSLSCALKARALLPGECVL